MGTVVTLDRSSPVPLTRQIYDFWRLGILSGRFRWTMKDLLPAVWGMWRRPSM
jgi:hypothetical protein